MPEIEDNAVFAFAGRVLLALGSLLLLAAMAAAMVALAYWSKYELQTTRGTSLPNAAASAPGQ